MIIQELFGKYIKRNNIEQTLSSPAGLASTPEKLSPAGTIIMQAHQINNDYHLQFNLKSSALTTPRCACPLLVLRYPLISCNGKADDP